MWPDSFAGSAACSAVAVFEAVCLSVAADSVSAAVVLLLKVSVDAVVAVVAESDLYEAVLADAFVVVALVLIGVSSSFWLAFSFTTLQKWEPYSMKNSTLVPNSVHSVLLDGKFDATSKWQRDPFFIQV